MVTRLLAKLGIPWEYVTRLIGASMVLYGMLIDHSGDRGTIILAGVGFLGYEFVQKSEPDKPKNPKNNNGTP